MRVRAAIVGAALLALGTAHAADIYRWVDENGRTQMSDRVPEQYRASAKRLGDSRQYELTAEQRQEAQRRDAQHKQLQDADEPARSDAQERAAEAAREAASTSAKAGNRNKDTNTAGAGDCAVLRREFLASEACWARFLNRNGTIKPGVVEACGPGLPDPSQRCGVPSH